jgi:hypothetical protein
MRANGLILLLRRWQELLLEVRIAGLRLIGFVSLMVVPVSAQWRELIPGVSIDAEIGWTSLQLGEWRLADGAVTMAGDWKMQRQAGGLSVTIPVRDITLSNPELEGFIGPINGDLNLIVDFVGGVESQGVQVLTIGRIEFADFEAEAVSLRFSLKPGATIAIGELSFNYAGGRVQLEPFSWNPEADRVELALVMEAIDMQVLSQLLPAWGFSLEGRVDGRLGLRVGANQFDLLPGLMRYRSGSSGRIIYRNEGWLTRGRSGNSQSRALRAAEEAFGDLQLEQLNLTINGFDTSGPQAVLEVVGEGKSRELSATVPVNLQINLSFGREDIASLPLFRAMQELLFP